MKPQTHIRTSFHIGRGSKFKVGGPNHYKCGGGQYKNLTKWGGHGPPPPLSSDYVSCIGYFKGREKAVRESVL